MSGDLVFREVEMTDRQQIEKLSSGIWEGHDYIPDIFEDWVEDGGFYCMELDGRIIALDKFTKQPNDVYWLEGLRVHADYQGKGYASKMVKHLMETIEQIDYSALRFMTTAGKDPVKTMAKEYGFEIKQVYRYLRMEEEDFEVNHLSEISQVTSSDEVLDIIYDSKEYVSNKEQYMAHWTTFDITDELIEKEVQKGNCYAVKNSGKIDSLTFFYYYEPYNTLSIPFITGSKNGMIELMKFGIEKCIENGIENYTIKTASDKIVDCAKTAGMEPSDHYEVLLYEKLD